MAARLKRGKPHICFRNGYWRVKDSIRAKWKQRTCEESRAVIAAYTFCCRVNGQWRKDVYC